MEVPPYRSRRLDLFEAGIGSLPVRIRPVLECATNRGDATVRRAEDVCLFRDEAQATRSRRVMGASRGGSASWVKAKYSIRPSEVGMLYPSVRFCPDRQKKGQADLLVCMLKDLTAEDPAGGLESVRSASANRAQAWSVVQIRSELAFSRGQRQGSPGRVLGGITIQHQRKV